MASSRNPPRALKTAGIGSRNPHILNRVASLAKMEQIERLAEERKTVLEISEAVGINIMVLYDILERNSIDTV